MAAWGLLLLAALLLAPLPAAAKYASIVIDADTGAVLHEVNADTRNYPASLTKIMTLYMVFDALRHGRLELEDKLEVSVRATRQPPSKLGLGPADTITVENAILALVTKSANDVAVVIAEALGVTEKRFARLMTNKALALGMSRTSYRNASGLPNKGQLSSARDMSILAQAMLRDFPELYGYFSTRRFTYRGATYRNHNKLLGKYDGMDGIKTGYIRASGYNLVASVERDGRRLIAVVFGGDTASARDRHMAKLLDRGFAHISAPAIDVAVARLVKPQAPERPVTALASVPVIAPATPSAPAAAIPGGPEWSIQVGAFRRYDQAQNAAELATRLAPLLLVDAAVHILPTDSQVGSLYRARLFGEILTGLRQAKDARTACRRLESKKMDCMVVAPRPSTELASTVN